MRKTVACMLFPALVSGAFALTASDDASNYTTPTWIDTSNQGTGFANWSLSSNAGTSGFAGFFIGDSTSGAGDVNTGSSQSFGMFANSDAGSSVEAIRSFSSSLTTNDQFTFDFAVNFTDGNRGFNLRTGGDSIIGLNIFSGGAATGSSFTKNETTTQVFDYGGGDQLLQAVIQVISPTSLTYQISRTSSQGNQGVLFAGTVTDIVGNIDNFNFYINGDATGDGDADNLYFNSLSVTEVPEPSVYSLLAGCFALAWVMVRRR